MWLSPSDPPDATGRSPARTAAARWRSTTATPSHVAAWVSTPSPSTATGGGITNGSRRAASQDTGTSAPSLLAAVPPRRRTRHQMSRDISKCRRPVKSSRDSARQQTPHPPSRHSEGTAAVCNWRVRCFGSYLSIPNPSDIPRESRSPRAEGGSDRSCPPSTMLAGRVDCCRPTCLWSKPNKREVPWSTTSTQTARPRRQWPWSKTPVHRATTPCTTPLSSS